MRRVGDRWKENAIGEKMREQCKELVDALQLEQALERDLGKELDLADADPLAFRGARDLQRRRQAGAGGEAPAEHARLLRALVGDRDAQSCELVVHHCRGAA